ncbi:hypothetical protein GGF48_005149 [Coemansia sp. RSA 921]|nr:hypothetical protein GGF48_005149 [Coemansia sp. RSA 921]
MCKNGKRGEATRPIQLHCAVDSCSCYGIRNRAWDGTPGGLCSTACLLIPHRTTGFVAGASAPQQQTAEMRGGLQPDELRTINPKKLGASGKWAFGNQGVLMPGLGIRGAIG